MSNHDEHYRGQDIEVILMQEMVADRLDKTVLTAAQKYSLVTALKYAGRMGRKAMEDASKEADKIANYFHRAVTGRWIGQ